MLLQKKNRKVLETYTEVWNKIKSLAEKINDKPSEYEKDYIKIRFNSDGNLPLNKTLKLHNITVVIRSVFEKDGKYCPQVFLDDCLYEL